VGGVGGRIVNEHRDERLFETLDPPADGLGILRYRLARERRVRRARVRFGWAAAVATPAALAFAVWFWGATPRTSVWDGVSPEALAGELVPEASAPVSIPEADRNRFAVQPIVETEKVVYYRFASLTTLVESADSISSP